MRCEIRVGHPNNVILLRRVLSGESWCFGRRSQRTRRYDAHLLPVVRELFSAVQADNVRAGERCCLYAARRTFRRSGKTVVPV